MIAEKKQIGMDHEMPRTVPDLIIFIKKTC